MESDIPLRRLGLEARYENGPWLLSGEYIVGNGYNLFSRADTRSRGFLLYSTLRTADNLDLVLGYDRFDPDLDNAMTSGAVNRANDRDRATIGLNYYLSREPVHRVMMNYEFRHDLEGTGVSSQGVRLRYQYSW